jgi:hypothetical protein
VKDKKENDLVWKILDGMTNVRFIVAVVGVVLLVLSRCS